ncbi:MAG: hypothetical protein ACLFTU_09845 [Puniceicoccaceae bacterium]
MPEEEESDPLIEQALRLGELRKEVMDRVGGPFLEGGSEDLPMDTQTAFWEHVLAFESAEQSTIAERLRNEIGFVPRPPGDLAGGDEVRDALWELLESLASIRVFVFGTDHLSDGELYELLVNKTLPEPTTVPPAGSEWNCRVDVAGHGTDDDPDGTDTWLRYYADDWTRDEWEGEVPPRETPPYDRDRFLPVPPEERAP